MYIMSNTEFTPVSAFDLDGTLLRSEFKPEYGTEITPRPPQDFFVFTGGLLLALHKLGHHNVLVTRAEQEASERLMVKHGIATPQGTARVDKVLGSEQSFLRDGTPSVLLSNGDKGYQLRDYMRYDLGRDPEQLQLEVAVGNSRDDLSMTAMANTGVLIAPEPELRTRALDSGLVVVDETDRITLQTPGNGMQELGLQEFASMQPEEMLGLIAVR